MDRSAFDDFLGSLEFETGAQQRCLSSMPWAAGMVGVALGHADPVPAAKMMWEVGAPVPMPLSRGPAGLFGAQCR